MSDFGAGARLVVPEGLVVDETVRERLERQLAHAPDAVAGVAGEVAELASGASYRVQVEWAALESQWSPASRPGAASAASGPIRGAVLLRPHVEFSVRDGRVEVVDGTVLVDPGAPVHDPKRTNGPLQPASERGRPPFPRRPVVVFLGCEPFADPDWLRRLVNRLVRTNVEARIATPDLAPGVQLTRPCLPTEATIRALAPDVVVTLDASAAASVDGWCEGDRSTVVVAFDAALAEPMELVSWQLGHASGRLRARIGPFVDVVAFAALVGRLCAGPHPMPPADQAQLLETRAPVRENWKSAAPPDAGAGCVIVNGATDAAAAARVAGLADNLEGAGVSVAVTPVANAASARDAGILLLVGVAPSPALETLIADRRQAGRPTVVDLVPADVTVAAVGDGPVARLTDSAAALADACGLVVSPPGVLHALAVGPGRRVLAMPTLLARSRAAALRDARTSGDAALVIGWRFAAGSDARGSYADAVADGIVLTLSVNRRNRVEIVGDAADVPAPLRGHERLTVIPRDRLDPETLAHWAVQVWTPALIGDDILDDARVLEEAGCAGVPSVMPSAVRFGVDGYVSPFVLVDSVERAEEWTNSLHHVLDDAEVGNARAEEAQRRADAVDSAAVSKAVVSRFAGMGALPAGGGVSIKRRVTAHDPVTVIVPVYGGLAYTARCLESVVRHADRSRVPIELLVIDDASPELPVSEYLDEFAAKPAAFPVTVLHNPENLGFVRTVNIGLRRATGDVVILNSDTAVTDGWLDQLAAAAAAPDVATVTPLTSHGSICTLPQSIIDAFALESASPRIDECADYVRESSLELLPEVITGVGFCMYVTRRALDLCGLLDEDTFGLGYGEEVDFCLRASRVGLRHLVEDSTFVYHRGGVSFGDGQSEGWTRSSAILDARYPFFRPSNTHERFADPLGVSFAALELALHERDATRPHVLHITHSRLDAMGGTEKYVAALFATLEHEFDFSVLYPVESGFALRAYWNVDGRRWEPEFLLPGAANQVTRINDEVAGAALTAALDLFDFDAVHIHNLIGHSLAPFDALADFQGPVVCSVHDLFLACPNFSLLYMKSDPCGIPEDLSVCRRCLADVTESPMPGSPPMVNGTLEYLHEFRTTVSRGLGTVDRWVFPSQSAADYFLRVYDPDPARVQIIEHGSIIRLNRRPSVPDASLLRDEPLRVAFVGLGWSKKGLDTVNMLAEAFRGSSVEIHHFGPLKQAASPELHAHGVYDNELLPELLHRAGIQVVLLPGAYAETFGIVMSEALAAGIPVIGARYGALAERIRANGCGWTIDPTDPDGIRVVIDRLDRARDELVRVTEHVLAVPLETVDDTGDRYAALYRPDQRGATNATPEDARAGVA